MREYLLTMFVAAATTYLLVGLCGRLAHRIGAVPALRERDVHAVPVPRLGGPAMLGGLFAAFLVASELPRMRQVFERYDDARALLTAALVICIVGVIDDIWELDALTKLAGQVLAAALLTVQGVQFLWIPLPSGTPFVLGQAQGVILTVLFVVTVMNAVNFVDGLDGLAAGVVGIGAGALFILAYLLSVEQSSRMNTPALITAVLTGICAGFLPHNVAPARIFMGDSGALLIGLLLAAGSVSLTGHYQASEGSSASSVAFLLLPLALPLAIVAIPVLDLVLAVVRRTRAGMSPFAADRRHLHHRLLDIGHSHRRAVTIIWLWSAVLSFGMVAAGLIGGWPTTLALVAGVLAAVVLTARGVVGVRRT